MHDKNNQVWYLRVADLRDLLGTLDGDLWVYCNPITHDLVIYSKDGYLGFVDFHDNGRIEIC